MKKIAFSFPFVMLLIIACCIVAGVTQGCSNTQQSASNAPAGQAKAQSTPVTCADSESSTGNFPPVPTVIDKTCAVIPLDLSGTPGQPPTDLYSWLTFVAVNWPADATSCAADPNASILSGPQNPTWLTFLSDDEIFVGAPQKPANWCYSPGVNGKPGAAQAKFLSAEAAATAKRKAKLAHLPPKVRALAQQHPEVQLFLHFNSKGQDLLISTTQLKAAVDPDLKKILDATDEPVTDQNGRFVRYTINVGQDEYKYIMAKSLWTKAGQKATGDLSFPYSKQSSPDELGAMEFKAAWKVLGANDNPAHFFTQTAIVYNDNNGSPSPGKNPVTVGLVGLHITHKTERQQKWLWATFEQMENDTQSFFNPKCSTTDCPPNVETATTPYFELNPDGTPHNKPVQVVATIETTAADLNKTFQGLLPNTPWAYYKLISTQWVGNLGSAPKPAKLGNTVLETFVSNTNPYSCMDCHNFARDTQGSKADFSFIIHAQQ
ncbi:MAG TPA: hypothetical protein VE054_13350 [Blattabacteriaceae bacterium]|nr:hypothetical protein [Blattabacteriaceae bacterium]